KGMGNVGRPTLVSVLKTLLANDQSAVEQAVAGIGDGVEAAQVEKQIDDLRAQAPENGAKLGKDKPATTKKAHEITDQRPPMPAKMTQAWAYRMAIVQSMGRRPQLISIWREVAPANEKGFTTEGEAKLRQSAVKAVGDFVDRAAGLTWAK